MGTPIHVENELVVPRHGEAGTGSHSQLSGFISFCETEIGRVFADYFVFERFAIDDYATFWSLLLRWSGVPVSGSSAPACEGLNCETARFFPNITLNYAEAVLTAWDETAIAVTACRFDAPDETITRAELHRRVARLTVAFRRLGIAPGDRIVAVTRNRPEAMTAALATAALGAVFSSCAPDMGAPAILSRFGSLAPKFLVAHLSAEPWDTGVPVADRVMAVVDGLPTLTHVVSLDAHPSEPRGTVPILAYAELLAEGDDDAVAWPRLPFDHPLFILFSSGTTGVPKCIVHGVGGTLLEHVKEHRLHGDLKPGDTLFFHTSCAWMMWNWQISALGSGAGIVLFDGPVQGPETLWEVVERRGVTVFGTSPAYLQLCETAAYAPRARHSLMHLRGILSTGSVLYDHQFDWVGEAVKDVPLQSISGGTDILGCFVLGNPLLPVRRGEAQCRSLALDVRALIVPGATGPIGELVCANPFPSRPLGLYGDTDGDRFHASYFAQNPSFWTHGDLIELTPHGGARIHGRSDGILNIRGIRVGPAEIYAILQSIDAVVDALAVEQQDPGGARLILVVVLREGLALTPDLVKTINGRLASQGSMAMVPARCLQVTDLPTTFSGKRSEAAARDIVNGQAARNRSALRNPDSLDELRDALAASVAFQAKEVAKAVSRGDVTSEAALEAALQGMVTREIGIPIGVDDNFFEVGASSLGMFSLLTEIQRFANRDLSFGALLAAPTVRLLTRLVWDGPVAEGQDESDQPRVRPVRQEDIEAICLLLRSGFTVDTLSVAEWRRLFEYGWIEEKPDLGYVLTVGTTIVGFIGTIYSHRPQAGGGARLACNLSSWYVKDAYRGWGSFLLAEAMRAKGTVFTSLTPGPETQAIMDHMALPRMEKRRFFLPFSNLFTLNARQIRIDSDPVIIRDHLGDEDRRILDDHAPFELLHLLVREGVDSTYLIVKRRRLGTNPRMRIPTSELLYCSRPEILARHFERIKLGILARQRTVILAAHEGFVPTGVPSVREARSGRYRSSHDMASSHLDLLYSELVLLPI